MARNLQRTPADLGLRAGVMFGVLMGLFLALFSVPFMAFTGPFACVGVPAVFLLTAVTCGPVFGGLMAVVAQSVTRTPTDLEVGETLLVWGGGNVSGNGGMLALSDRRLWFASHAMNFARPDFSIRLSEIDAVDGTDGLLAGRLVIRTHEGKRHEIKLDFASRWADHVRDELPDVG